MSFLLPLQYFIQMLIERIKSDLYYSMSNSPIMMRIYKIYFVMSEMSFSALYVDETSLFVSIL